MHPVVAASHRRVRAVLYHWAFASLTPKESAVDMENTAPAGSPEPGGDSTSGSLPASTWELHDRAHQVQRELEHIFHSLLKRRREAAGTHGKLEPGNLKLNLELPQPGSGNHSSDQLYLQLQGAAERYANRASSMPLGRVYCHWCRSFFCEHASPPEPRSVFGGYTPTGQPTWPEFVSVLLERHHPRVDTIFGGTPSLITVLHSGHELTKAQLPIYGKSSPICRILGQVTLGYIIFPEGLSLPQSSAAQRTPLALTLQAVESGSGSFLLNVLGKLPDGTPAFQAFEESWDTRLADALHSTRRDLEEISLRNTSRRKKGSERQRLVMGALHRLEKNLDRIFRQRERRTQHSQERHTNRGRPTSTAFRDALEAAPEAIFRDVEERTWVVIGPKNRVHVFNDQARHVTSIVYSGETVRARTTRGKWREPKAEERLAFRRALERHQGDRHQGDRPFLSL